MFDSTGTRFDFPVTAGLAERFLLKFNRRDSVLDLTGATWRALAKGTADPAMVDGLSVEHGDVGELVLWVPALKEDLYWYELFATADDGSVRRVLYGAMTAIHCEHAARLEQRAAKESLRTLAVTVPDGTGTRLELQWVASTVSASAASSALRAAGEAKQAAAQAASAQTGVQQTVEELQRVSWAVSDMEGRLDAIDGHIQASVVPDATTNTWWVAGKDTHYPVTGEPGKSPYIGERGTFMVWDDTLQAYVDTGVDPHGKPGRAPVIAANGNWARYDEVEDVWVDTGVPARGRDGVDGMAVRRIVVQSVDEIPTSGATCNGGFYYYVPDEESQYDVYAWLETPSGGAAWVCVGLADDLATAEVFGLVKTSTDVTVEDGAPVGVNGQRQLSVPKADYVTPGAVRPSVATTLGSGGGVGLDADGRMLADMAGYRVPGAVALSFNGICEVGCIGLMADGTIGLPWATLQQPGAVRLGSAFNQLNRIPYQQGVGATGDHQLANNLLFGGAIQHKKLAAWLAHGMEWLSGMPETPFLNDHDFYMGLVTSAQFSQGEGVGLVLKSATTDMLAGVYLANGMDDTRRNAVPSAATVSGHLRRNHYTKDEVYTKSEADGKFPSKQDFTTALQDERRYVDDNFVKKVDFNRAMSGVVKCTNEWEGDVVMTESEYNGLTEINPKTKYILI